MSQAEHVPLDISHHHAHSLTNTMVKFLWNFSVRNETPYLTLTGELWGKGEVWGVFCEFFNEK